MTSAAALDSLSDFSDRLSPMVVKELRQGLRTRMFRGVLLVLHVLLILITLVTWAAENPDRVRWLLDTLSVLALCVVLPLCGFSALAGEMKSRTLETLVLTRLSAARIVFGKWVSLAAQSALVAVSLAPYYVARYAFGGSELLGELTTLAIQWLIGVVLAAGIVCLSTQKPFWLRALVVALVLLGPSLISFFFIFTRSFSMAAGGGAMHSTSVSVFGIGSWGLDPLWSTLVIVLTAAWAIFYFLSLGATRIAPAASNLALWKRPVHGVMLAALITAAWLLPVGRQQLLQVAAVVAWLASVDALIENRMEVPTPLVPFYRRGWLGRVLAWFLTPGWPNGMLFSLVAVAAPAVAGTLLMGTEQGARLWLSCASVWLTAFILHISSLHRRTDLLTPYLALVVFFMFVNWLVLMITGTLTATTGTLWPGLLLPDTVAQTVLIAQSTDKLGGATVEELLVTGVAISLIWPLLLGLLALTMARYGRRVRLEARRLAGEPA
jgi:ABC-type transport system involved in multi-copper enzyme maturation permease subunit